MRIHFIQHVPFEYPGSAIDWATANNYTTSFTKIYETALFPSTDMFDMLIISGGPMGVYEEEKYACMKAEKSFIKQTIEARKKVLGICLGAQLIAECLGANVFPHSIKEIGWFPVEKVAHHIVTNHLPQTFTTFHWHGDTFTLPENALQLFKTNACEQQGFIYEMRIAGLQFHMEVKEDLLNSMTDNEHTELIKATYVQTEEEIKQLTPAFIQQQKQFMFDFLTSFTAL